MEQNNLIQGRRARIFEFVFAEDERALSSGDIEIIHSVLDELENDRKNCPYRHENGNCLPIGGFCLSVDDKYCKFKQEYLQEVENETDN